MSNMEEGSEQQQRYFCHQCNETCIPQPPEFLCPTCNEGFIEPVAVSPLSSPSPSMFPPLPQDLTAGLGTGLGQEPLDAFDALQTMHSRFTQMRTEMQDLSRRAQVQSMEPPVNPGEVMSGSSSRTRSTSAPGTRADPTTRAGSAASPGHSHRVHSSNVSPNSSVAGHGNLFGPGSSRIRFVLGDGLNGPDGAPTDIPTLFSMIMAGLNGEQQPMVGNPGDYAWGPGGLDNIISQLIGQLDGSGPPPAQEQTIESLPDVYIPKKHLDNKLDCTVCQEFFTGEEKVKELPCNHYFHIDCIIPWLKLHNSCPICRVSIDGQRNPEDVAMSSPRSAGDGDSLPDLEEDPTDNLTTMTQSIHEDDLD